MRELYDNEQKLINELREEAWRVKDCFTQYSFNALAFASISLGLIVSFLEKNSAVALGSVPLFLLLSTVARIGTHKYSTANRNYGYQLHLERLARIQEPMEESGNKTDSGSVDTNTYKRPNSIGWEEAMRAWRVVQATAFEKLYHTERLWWWSAIRLKREYRIKKSESGENVCRYNWFEPPTLVVEGTKWHSGGYIKNMLIVIHLVAFLTVVPLFYLTYTTYAKYQSLCTNNSLLFFCLTLILTLYVFCSLLSRIYKVNARKKLLETGLLSIHSCSIMWHAVVTAHQRALDELKKTDGFCPYKGLTEQLSVQAKLLSENITGIHKWIEGENN